MRMRPACGAFVQVSLGRFSAQNDANSRAMRGGVHRSACGGVSFLLERWQFVSLADHYGSTIATYIQVPVPFAAMEPNMNDELWRVQLSTGEIRTMTLDGLDRAFDEGLIDARVPVLAPGSATWTTLGEAAGLESDVVEQAPSLSPIALPGPDSVVSISPLPPAPSNLDLEIPDDLDMGRPKRGLLLGVVPGILAVAAALVVVVTKLGAEPPVDVKVAPATQLPAAAAEVLPAPAAAPSPAPVATSTESGSTRPALSEWQKQLLEATDKAREAKARVKEKLERAPVKKPTVKASPGFLNGGDKFDPLNGAL
jgi:hypothetical protein